MLNSVSTRAPRRNDDIIGASAQMRILIISQYQYQYRPSAPVSSQYWLDTDAEGNKLNKELKSQKGKREKGKREGDLFS